MAFSSRAHVMRSQSRKGIKGGLKGVIKIGGYRGEEKKRPIKGPIKGKP